LKAIRKEKKKSNKSGQRVAHFSALNLIYDPQDFAEKLFKLVETTNEGFEIKLNILDVISRLIGVHSLFVMNFHSFLIRFLNPHQREVTKILWFAAISAHDLTPPDTVESVLMAIANNFITERNTSEVIAVGLNAIREICGRCPLAMNEDLLGDLVQYKTYKDKPVSYAAKSLIQIFRETNPQMLHRKLRGKPTEEEYANGKTKQYGEVETKMYVPGAEAILSEDEQEDKEGEEDSEWEEGTEEELSDDENEEKKTKSSSKKRKHSEEEDEEDSDEDDGWIKVSSDEEAVDAETESDVKGVDTSKMTLEEKEKRAMDLSSQKIFTQEDFKRIRMEQMKKKLSDKGFVKDKKKKKMRINLDSDGDEDEESRMKSDGLVPLTSITHINAKKKHDKESRVLRVQEGREGREKFGQRFKDPKLGKTNKEKAKNKSFQMLRHKINRKHKRSYKDKQLALRNSLLKQKRLK
jgi:protein SDA1